MSGGGFIYGVGGELFATVSLKDVFVMGGHTFTAELLSEGTPGLRLSRVIATNNCDERRKLAFADHANELRQRQLEVVALDKEIAELTRQAEEGEDDIGDQLTTKLSVRGKHKQEIKRLVEAKTITVHFQETHQTSSVVLLTGVFTKLPWFDTPLLWCSPVVPTEDTVVVERKEEMTLEEEYLYAVGGYNDSNFLSSVERFDRTQWTTVASLQTARDCHGVAVFDGHLYAVGGDNGSRLSSVERFDGTQWTKVASLQTARQYLGVAVFDGHLFAVGGYNGSNTLSSVERFDGTQWTTVASLQRARESHGVA